MARAAKKKASPKKRKPAKKPAREPVRPLHRLVKWTLRTGLALAAVMLLAVAVYAVFNPPTTPYMLAQGRERSVDYLWVDLEDVAPVMGRSVVAAEDANFCLHWGFDMAEIRRALDQGGRRGASTITQQVVKNVYLWQGRSWLRKALEAVMTPMVEAVWSKRRILEVYLNVVEFAPGVFGVEAAARASFGVGPEALSGAQAARLAAVLPDPKGRSATHPSAFVAKRARAIADGAATILADGRAACFES